MDAGAVVAHIKADITDFQSGIKQAKDDATSFGSHLQSIGSGIADFGKQAAVFTGIVGGGLALFAKSSIDAYSQQEKASAQTEAVLQSTAKARIGVYEQVLVGTKSVTDAHSEMSDKLTHATAKLTDLTNKMKDAKNPTEMQKLALSDQQKEVEKLTGSVTKNVGIYTTKFNPAMQITADDVSELSSKMEDLTTYSDETVQSGVNMLLTFTNVGKKVLPDATTALLDMSTAMGQDVTQTAIQLGKALNDPVLGATALRRVGVQLTDQQQEQIKTLVSQNKLYDAQQIIIKELATEFGGSAAAAANTWAGQLQKLQNTINNLQEEIGYWLIRALYPLFDILNKFVSSDGFTQFIYRISAAWNAFMIAVNTDDVGVLTNILTSLGAPGLIEPLGRLAGALRDFGTWIAAHKDLVITFLEGLGVAVGALLVIGTVTIAIMALTNPIILVSLAIAALFTAWQTNFLGIQQITQVVFSYIQAIITDVVMPIIAALTQFISDHWLAISTVTQATFNIIVGIIKVALGLVLEIFTLVAALITGNWSKATDGVVKSGEIMWDGLKQIFTGILQMIIGFGEGIVHNLVSPFEDAWHKISDLMNKIKDALDFTKRHSPSVVDIVQKGVGLVNRAMSELDFGISPMAPQVSPAATIGAVGGGANMFSINLDMSGAVIADELGAMRIGEMLGDSIIKKLGTNVRH